MQVCVHHTKESVGAESGQRKSRLSSSSHSTCQSSLRTRTCFCLPSKGPSHIGCPLWKILHILRWEEWLHQSFTDIGEVVFQCHLTPFSSTDGFTLAPSIPVNVRLGGLGITPISLARNGFHLVLRT